MIKQLSFILLVFPCFLYAQKADRVEVKLIMDDGSTIETMMYYYPDKPWTYQKELITFDPSLKEAPKIKKKDITKYGAKNLTGYEMDGRQFEAHRVMSVGDSEIGKVTKAIPTYAFVEVLIDGPIRVYKGYGYPPLTAGDLSKAEIEARFLDAPDYFISKEGQSKGRVRRIDGINIRNWIEDAPATLTSFDEGVFGNYKRKKGKGIGNLVKGMGENDDPEMIISVIRAYNAEMAK